MPPATAFIGHKAFAQCQQPTEIDLSQTQVDIVHMCDKVACSARVQRMAHLVFASLGNFRFWSAWGWS